MDNNLQSLGQLGKIYNAIGDLYHFNREILGYEQMNEQPHRLMCDSVQSGGKSQLHLWPRGHFKSTMITVGYTLYKIALNPNIRILIANATLANSKSFLREIKGHLERNEKLRAIIGDQVSKDEKWTETEIIVKSRTLNLKEPTIQVAGVGQGLASQHYDLIIGDDLVNELTITTPEQIQKTIDWYKMANSLLEPNGDTILIGTRYHFGDIYGWIIKEFSDEYKPQIHAVYKDGELIFPSRFTEEIVAKIRKKQGSYMFSCQYMNNPVDDENAKFKKGWIKYLPTLPDKQFYTTMTVDRAYSLAKTADYTGVSIRKKDDQNFRYVPYAHRQRYSEGELVDKIFDLRKHYKVDKVGIEQKAFLYTLKPILDEEMRRRNEFFEVVEIKSTASKIQRIEGLVPFFESGSMYFVGEEKDFIELEDELLRFPVAEHDDLVDSLAMHDDEEMAGGVNSEVFIPPIELLGGGGMTEGQYV
jgi:predicted phage terminase large subunit-like protein